MAATDYVKTEDFLSAIVAYTQRVVSVPTYRWHGPIQQGMESSFGGQPLQRSLADPGGFVVVGFTVLAADDLTGSGDLGRGVYPVAFRPVIPSQGKYLEEDARMNALFDKLVRELFHLDNLNGSALADILGSKDPGPIRHTVTLDDVHVRLVTWNLTSRRKADV